MYNQGYPADYRSTYPVYVAPPAETRDQFIRRYCLERALVSKCDGTYYIEEARQVYDKSIEVK